MSNWHLKTKPYPVQTEALKRSQGKKCWAQYLEMGLGKSAVTLSEFIQLCMEDVVQVLVIICPSSLKEGWKTEAEKQGVNCDFHVWPKVPKNVDSMKSPFIVSVNYEAVGVGRGEKFIENLSKKFPVYLCLDESIALKNNKSRRTKACLRLSKLEGVKIKRLLSGAPMTQGPHDLWAQLTFLEVIPGFRYHPFRYTFCILGGYMGKQIIGVQNEERLNGILKSTSFRALKKDWLDLGEKTYKLWPVELTKVQKKIYIEIEQDLYTYIADHDVEVSASIVLTKLIKLRQILSGFVIADDGSVIELEGGTKRLQETYDIVEQAGKVVIAVQFNKSVEMLLEKLKPFNPACIRGKKFMTGEEIEENKLRFNEDPDCGALVCQIQSAKYGHTLVGSDIGGRCFTEVFYENTFSLDDRIQFEDRIHRIGQKNACLFIDFYSGPIDLKISQSLQRKVDIAKAVVDGIRN